MTLYHIAVALAALGAGLGIGFDAWYSGGDGSHTSNPHTLTDDVKYIPPKARVY